MSHRNAYGDDAPVISLDELDELLMSVSEADQQAFTSYLEDGGDDLRSAVRQHEEQMHAVCDRFIQAHVEQADAIGELYNQFSECESRLVDFETEILTFQKNLEETSTDIVKMQMQTDALVRSVNNRRQVSNKINEVYTALQECDSFCDEIANKEVDRAYLNNLRELDRKIFFLSTNKALQHSAVDNEIRPKLTAAAQKAGHKLKRYLSDQIGSLVRDGADIDEQQQYLRQSAQFAYRFLQLYNAPVARDVLQQYVRSMSQVYLSQFRALTRVFAEASELHAQPLDPIITADEAFELVCNRDSGAGSGNQIAAPPLRFPARTLSARRERSVSQPMAAGGAGASPGAAGGAASSTPLRSRRPASFDDTAKTLNSLCVRHGKLQPDSKVAVHLDQGNSWVWQFTRCFHTLVSRCVEECRFIGSFFCAASELEGGENYTDAEQIARAVLGGAVGAVLTSVQSDLPLVMDRVSVLAALRVTDTFRQYLCTFLDPVPLMLLSGVLETTKASLKMTLVTVVDNDTSAVEYLAQLRLSPLRKPLFGGSSAGSAELLSAAKAGGGLAALGPHALLYRVGDLLAQLEWLNNAVFRSSAFAAAAATSANKSGSSGTGAAAAVAAGTASKTAAAAAPSPVRVYDTTTNAFLLKALAALLDLTVALSRRHAGALPQSVFAAVNVYCTYASWRSTAEYYPVLKDNAEAARLPEALSGCVAAEPHVRLLAARLQESLEAWAHAALRTSDTDWAELVRVTEADDSGSADAAAAAVVERFAAGGWRDQWRQVAAAAEQIVRAALGSARSSRNGALVDARCAELTRMLLRAHGEAVVAAYARLAEMVSAVPSLQSKLLSTAELEAEVFKSSS